MLLAEKMKVNQTELMNRIVLPPMASEKAMDGYVTDALCDFYQKIVQDRATGLVITEHSYVNMRGKASPGQLSMADDAVTEGLKRLVTLIHAGDAKAIAQISHAGSKASSTVTGMDTVAPSALTIPGRQMDVPNALSFEEIRIIVRQFKDAAKRAIVSGFDGVEIHAAHGFLLNQFYSPLTNRREDAYGGSLENRIRIHREIAYAIREVIGDEKILALRFGACDDYPGGSTMGDAVMASLMFESSGVDLLDISGGLFGFSSPGNEDPVYFRAVAREIKKHVTIPVLLTGGITTGKDAEQLLKDGVADLIGVGRAVLKHSSWAKEALKEH